MFPRAIPKMGTRGRQRCYLCFPGWRLVALRTDLPRFKPSDVNATEVITVARLFLHPEPDRFKIKHCSYGLQKRCQQNKQSTAGVSNMWPMEPYDLACGLLDWPHAPAPTLYIAWSEQGGTWHYTPCTQNRGSARGCAVHGIPPDQSLALGLVWIR